MSEGFLAGCRAIGAVVALTGVGMLFVVEHDGPGEFVFFTTQSNLLVGGCFVWGALAPWLPAGPPTIVRGSVTLNILVTFLVFHLVLANPASGFSDGSVQFGTVQNVLLHTVSPLLALLDWVLIRAERPRWRWAGTAWLIYPLSYFAFVLVRGAIVHSYPYPFLDVGSLGYAGVTLSAVGLFAVFWLLGLLVVAVTRVRAPVAATGSP